MYMYNNYIHFRVLVRHYTNLEPKANSVHVHLHDGVHSLSSRWITATCIVHDVHVYSHIVLLTFPPGPLVGRAALYTAGVVGGLSLTAACAPSDKYLKWGGPLALGLGVVFVSSIGTVMHTCCDVHMYACIYT